MKQKKFLKTIVFILLISAIISMLSIGIKQYNIRQNEKITDIPVKTSVTKVINTDEMRGLWVPYMSLDLSGTDRSFKSFKDKFNKIASNAVSSGLNTLIVHVRPFCDALYKSKLFPSSHVLSGTQGKDPGFDALEHMVKVCHEKGLKIHAWINPLRITSNKGSFELSNENIAKKYNDKGYIATWENGIYLNPAYSEVRKLIIDGVREITENYDVDGIHFDDYFYPTTSNEFDKESYEKYLNTLNDDSTPLTLSSWRTSNINMLISGVYSAVHSSGKDIVFGISPQGNIDNNKSLCADVSTWSSISGYVDYLCPQIYVNSEHSILPFEETADKWKKLVEKSGVKLYIGLALYKAGSDDDDGTWKNSDDIIMKQIEYSRNLKTDGFMLYSYEYLTKKQTEKEVVNIISILT